MIVTSHHSSRALGDGTGLGGTKQDDALTTAAWLDFLGAYPHVILHLAGHSHEHHSELARPLTGHPYWEIETASLADFPGQMKVVEIWDEDDGFLRIRGIPLDYSEEGDPLTAQFRRMQIADWTAGWSDFNNSDPEADEFWIPK